MILKVEACGICAGDTKAYAGAASFWGFDGQPKYIKEPMIPGHEFVGKVVEIGPNVKGNWKLGDRICPEQIVLAESVCSVRQAVTGCARNMTCSDSRRT